MKQIISYETCDGKLFTAKEEAERHERTLDRAKQRDAVDIYLLGHDQQRIAEWVQGSRIAEQ